MLYARNEMKVPLGGPSGIWLAWAYGAHTHLLRKGPSSTYDARRLTGSHHPLKHLGLLGSSPLSPPAVRPTGPVGEALQVPDKDTKAMMGTEDTPGGKASLNPQDLRPSVFHSIKVPLRAWQERGYPSWAGQALPLTGHETPSTLLPFPEPQFPLL